MIRMDVSCWNCKCKHYYEDMCLRDFHDGELIFLDIEGKCINFEEGECMLYQDEE